MYRLSLSCICLDTGQDLFNHQFDIKFDNGKMRPHLLPYLEKEEVTLLCEAYLEHLDVDVLHIASNTCIK